MFPSATDTNPVDVELMNWLKGYTRYSFLIDQIRRSDSKHQRDQFKRQLPCITPSGTFSKRNRAGLIQHSGLIAFDIDNLGDDLEGVRSAVQSIPNVAYLGLSASGTGLWGLIPITQPDQHTAHFRAMELAFLAMGITIDPSCKDVSRLRFYSYDEQAYFNHDAVPFDQTYTDPPKPVPVVPTSGDPTGWAVRAVLNAPDGQKHHVLNRTAFLLGKDVAAGKVSEDAARQALREAIGSRSCADIEHAYRTIDQGLRDGQARPIVINSG